MSVAVGIDPASWLQQDIGQTPPDIMPDVTQLFSIFKWGNNLAPAVTMTDYKVELALFTTADIANPSYSDPHVLVRYHLVDTSQCISMVVNGVSTPPVISGVEKRAWGLTYEPSTGLWAFYIRRTAAWEIVGTIRQSFEGTPFTQMRTLNDNIASIGSVSSAYTRVFNGVKLSLDRFEAEANSGVAVTPGVTTDTPLIAVTDLDDVNDEAVPFQNQWKVNGSGLSTALPGPLTAGTSFLVVPESDPGLAGTPNPVLVVAGIATTTGSPLSTVAVNQIVDPPTYQTASICAKRDGGWWQACDNTMSGFTDLLEYDLLGVLTRTISLSVLVGNAPPGPGAVSRNDLYELPTLDLVTVLRNTGGLIRLSAVDGSLVQEYGLTIASAYGLDGAVNSLGTRLLYLDVVNLSDGPTHIKVWALDDDTDRGVLFTDPVTVWSLRWLPKSTGVDCSVMFRTNDTGVVARRYTLQGRLLKAFVVDPAVYPAGSDDIDGLVASVATDRVWWLFHWSNGQSERLGVLAFHLMSGEVIPPEVPLLGGLTAYANVSAVTQPYYENLCVPSPPAPLPSNPKQWLLERFDITDRREETA